MDTLLVLSGIGIPDYTARGLTESLSLIGGAANLRRTVNGGLKDLSAGQFRKYRLEISCADQETPVIQNMWPGIQVTVDCVSELAYLTSGGSPERTVVPGSSRVNGSFTVYRPRLTMRVMEFNVQKDEWGAVTSWTLSLEEE